MLLCENARRWRLAGTFLAARFCGYALLMLAAYGFGRLSSGMTGLVDEGLFQAAMSLFLGALLLRYSLKAKNEACAATCTGNGNREAFGRFRGNGTRFAARSGFLTGLGLCAPMMAIVAEGSRQETLLGTATSFFHFFLGTSAVLLPLFACGFVCGGRTKTLRTVGFLAGFLAGAVYLLHGLHLLTLELLHG
jgi:hypothetical protein